MLKATAIKAGSREPVEIYLTRQFAVRVYCDCYGHALSRKSWVFVLATDRDSLDMYVKRGDDPPSAPWLLAAQYNEHELHVCGARMAIEDNANHLIDPDAILSADDPSVTQQVAWWGSGEDQERIGSRKRRASELEAARNAYELKRRAGLVDGTEPDRPKDESNAMAARRRKAEIQEAQPGFELPNPRDDEPRDLDERK